jgi:hypothetical protein
MRPGRRLNPLIKRELQWVKVACFLGDSGQPQQVVCRRDQVVVLYFPWVHRAKESEHMKKKETPEYPSARTIATRDPFRYQRPSDPVSLRLPASPYDRTLSLAAVAWLSELPPEIAPLTLAHQFPRIVNRLARFWDSPRMIDEYLQQLLVDKRGKRKGFPLKVVEELYRLAEYFQYLHNKSESTDLWDSIPYRKSGEG